MSTDEKLQELDAKVDKIYASVEKTRKYLFWKMLITVVIFILPLIGLLFVLPSFFGRYTTTLQELGL